MIRYSLARLAQQRRRRDKGTRITLPPIGERVGTVQDYYRALRTMLSEISREVTRSVMPVFTMERQFKRRGLDAGGVAVADVDESAFERLRAAAELLTRQAAATVDRILGLEARRHSVTFMAQARSVLGVDLSAVVQQEDLTDYLRSAAARNTSLIKSLSAQVVARVEQDVLQAGIRGDSVQALKDTLMKTYGVVDARAQLIARDQTAKLNSDLNRIRQEQAGVASYQWSTSHDERVRPLHKGLDGNEYKWGQRTGAEDGLPPGQPIQCRCVAMGIVEFGVYRG